MVWDSHLFQNFRQYLVIHKVKGFGIVNKAEIDIFLKLSCFFHDPPAVGNLISGSSAFSKTSLNIRKFTVHVLLKPGLENFEHYFTSMWEECNCAVVWAFFGIAFLWDWNENGPFPVLWEYMPPNYKRTHLKRCMHPNVHGSTVCDSQNMEAIPMSNNREVYKEYVPQINQH